MEIVTKNNLGTGIALDTTTKKINFGYQQISTFTGWPASIPSGATYVRINLAPAATFNVHSQVTPINIKPGTMVNILKTNAINAIRCQDGAVLCTTGITVGSFMNVIWSGTAWLVHSYK